MLADPEYRQTTGLKFGAQSPWIDQLLTPIRQPGDG
jgi:hypothetical protein